MSVTCSSRRSRVVALLFAAALVLTACGSSGDSDASGDPTTTVAAAGEPAETSTVEADDVDVDIDADDLVETEDILFDEEFCEAVPEDFYTEVTGTTITEIAARGGIGFIDDVEYATASCVFDMDDGGIIVVEMLLDPETDEPAGADLFESLEEISRSDTMSGFEHADVDGIGDQAIFVADAFDNKLMILFWDTAFFVSGKDGEFDTLERPEVEQIATITFDDLG